jgi:UDPglucose 6-dehydrogenase
MYKYTAEELILMKYTVNSFLATKVAFFNQLHDLCEASGVTYDNVQKLVAHDSRIGDSHMEITQERGFGGHCFPKDTSALLDTASRRNTNLSILAEAVAYNEMIRND